MLLRNSSTGGFQVYNVSNNNITNTGFLGTVGLNWQAAGFGDFNRDSMTDMVLRNNSSGTFQVYNIVNNSITASATLGTVGLDWQVGGFGNFAGLGESDMILCNTTSGALLVYDISNNQITNAAFMGTVGLNWQIVGFGNFGSVPGQTDMIMRNTTTGGFEVYNIANNQITGAAFLGTVGLDWQVAGNGFGQYLRYMGFCWPVPRSLVGGRLFTAVGIKPHDNPSHSAGLAPADPVGGTDRSCSRGFRPRTTVRWVKTSPWPAPAGPLGRPHRTDCHSPRVQPSCPRR